jgi:tRNA U34 5-carboxymethylaminomethyl modifying GTPase MnmE/TrmE
MLLLEVGLMQNDKIQDKFLTSAKFSENIENIVKDSNGLVNYIEAIVSFCEDNDIEFETASKLISKPLKEKIKYQAQTLNYMKKTSRGILPL